MSLTLGDSFENVKQALVEVFFTQEENPIRATKEKKMEVRQPILILGGVTVGATKNFDKNVISARAGVQLRNGKQLEVGLDTEQRILVGVKAPIFKIK